jgi:hypothetical protein
MSEWRAANSFLVAMRAGTIGRTQAAETGPTNGALTFNSDGALRSGDLSWPNGFHLELADLFAHNENVLQASCEKVFVYMSDAQAWSSWYPNSRIVILLNSLHGKIHEEARSSWEIVSLDFQSRVHEFVPNSRSRWSGDRPTNNGYHTYLWSKSDEGGRVVPEKAVKGPGAIEQAMHEGHDLWVRNLKQRSEH